MEEKKDKLVEPGKSFLDAAKLQCHARLKEAEAQDQLRFLEERW